VGPYEAQWPACRGPVTAHFHSVGDGDAVAGMASRWRGWSHRVELNAPKLNIFAGYKAVNTY
jgi:hypothetical protein